MQKQKVSSVQLTALQNSAIMSLSVMSGECRIMKSVFLKYILVFSLIILVSFLMLSSIVSVSIDEYASDARKRDVILMGNIATSLIEEEYGITPDTTLEAVVSENKDDLTRTFRSLTTHASGIGFLLTDMAGNVLIFHGLNVNSSTKMNTAYISRAGEDGSYIETGNLGGILHQAHIVCASPVKDVTGEQIGALFSCSSTSEEDALLAVLNKSIFLSNLWIMIAVIIAVDLIVERFLTPLREMNQAAKDFAKGKFDARVTVTGKDEVADFAMTFNQMAESLSQSERLRSTFLANVSHDLRTPMTTIAGFVDGIRSGAIPPEKRDYYLGIVSEEVHRLSRLVSQLLDISRMESGVQKFHQEKFDICEVTRLTLISFERQIEEKQLCVELDCAEDAMQVYADRDAMHQIIYNIVENAVKFSRSGGLLRLSIQPGERGKYEVVIYNEGEGVPAEDLPYIFDRFYKTDKSRGLDKVGVGLGLYIAKTILNANDERIWAESEEGKYCAFHFTVRASN